MYFKLQRHLLERQYQSTGGIHSKTTCFSITTQKRPSRLWQKTNITEQLGYASAVLRSKQARNTILYKPKPLGLGRMDVVHQMDFLAIQEATGTVPKWRWCPDLLHCARVTVAVLTPKKEVSRIKTFCINFKRATKIIITYQHLENLLVKHWQ